MNFIQKLEHAWTASNSLLQVGLDPDPQRFPRELQGKPGVDYAGFFGAALHVSGRDRAALEQSIAPYRSQDGVTVTETPPNLEDVFIQIMGDEK